MDAYYYNHNAWLANNNEFIWYTPINMPEGEYL
jgi:hypothetical protein